MRFDWIDYPGPYRETVEPWLDPEAKRFTGMEEGFSEFYRYWANTPETRLNENFWFKVIVHNGEPIGVIAVALWEGVFTVSEFLLRPDRRSLGLGSAILRELLNRADSILGQPIENAQAVIFPGNRASQRAFENAGFVFESAHPDGDALYYRYFRNKPVCGKEYV